MYAVIACLLISGMAFAQDMSRAEKYETAYKETRQGRIYVGKCTTHQDHERKYFSISSVAQKYVEPQRLNDAQLKALLKKFDPALLGLVLKAFDMDPVKEKTSTLEIFKNYIDDVTVETLSHKLAPQSKLIRFNLGVGGGNGGYVTVLKVPQGHKLMSYVFDGDVEYCDRMVWMNR